MAAPAKPKEDTRPEQAVRAADYLETHPGATAKEIDAACDVGSVTKVLSDMQRLDLPGMGYGIARDWRQIPCAGGTHVRKVRTYTLLHRPRAQPDLFNTE
ncbi:hypothetical protein C8C94_4863 [Acidovorax sp. 94]|jgi:hypothetical protein|uniref:hypothetical protein n=1 Tax=unclassified Acidovorax TaxID=2684926 RepID=UPI000EAB76FA|nr:MULTISPECIES: hypothetical protein [unclassified Acidovorax]MBV7458784.1 hypothetical protein [Acidovorax sp. sif0632]MBV7463394.1 hypothetical protein [Acidovorax sp. sif0613]RKR70316.1 hypothetical protein C8C94_4863 [Acidovorax sp. 94]